VANTGGVGVAVRDAPGGRIIAFLPEGAPVEILYQRETIEDVTWIEVRDVLGRDGWVPAIFLSIRP
jgi:hypothetical protein